MKNLIKNLSQKQLGLIYILLSIIFLSILVSNFNDLSLFSAYFIVFSVYFLFSGFSKIITKHDNAGNIIKTIPKKINFIFSYTLIILGIFFIILPWILIISKDLGLLGLAVLGAWFLLFLPLGGILIGYNIRKIRKYNKIKKEFLELNKEIPIEVQQK